jgi:hypothetical protein
MPIVTGSVKFRFWRAIIPIQAIAAGDLSRVIKKRNRHLVLIYILPHGGILSRVYHNLDVFGITSAISG